MNKKAIPQKTREIRICRPGGLFLKDCIGRAQKWSDKIKIHRDELLSILQLAGCPDWTAFPERTNYLKIYRSKPDFAADLLNFLCLKWRVLKRTPSGRLKIFLSGGYLMDYTQPPATPDLSFQQLLSDCEIATAFQKWSNKIFGLKNDLNVSDPTGLVRKARSWVCDEIESGEIMLSKKFDSDGYLKK